MRSIRGPWSAATWSGSIETGGSEPQRHRVLEGGQRLDHLLVKLFPEHSRSRLSSLVRQGAVRVNGLTVKPSLRLKQGDEILLSMPEPEPATPQPEDLPLEFLYRDAHLAVVFKPAGMVVHPAPGHPRGTLVHALLHHLHELSGIGGVLRPGIVHRLDKGTSGVMVVACHDQSHRALQQQFAEHSMERRYQALVIRGPRLASGRVESLLGRHPRDRLRFASQESGGKRAVTHWRLLERYEGAAELECRLETGRTHQVRVHMMEQGWPLLGDGVYHGGQHPRAWIRGQVQRGQRPFLHARTLGLTHPATGERMHFEAPPPEDYLEVRAALRRGSDAK